MINKPTRGTLLLAAFTLLAGGSYAGAQVAVPASFAHPSAQLNASALGFKVRTVQATNDSGTLFNSTARAEAQLAGVLINPKTNKPYENIADTTTFTDGGYYDEPGVIDYDVGGTMPGLPSPSGSTINIAMEVLTYLDLKPGTYTMTVSSDDGFRVTVGPDARDQFSAIELGVYDGGRGVGDTSFSFTISQAGAYHFRLLYEQGDGGGVVQWYSGSGDTKVLINNPGDPTALKAYRALTTPSPDPYFEVLNPGVNSKTALPNTTVTGTIVDSASAQVNATSLKLFFDGTEVSASPQKSGSKTTYSYKPSALLKAQSTHQVRVVYADAGNTVRTNDYQFTVANFGNLTLPTPFYLETFDEVQEGALPTGWTVTNFTDDGTAGDDLDDPKSDSYKNWVVISKARVQSIGDAGKWDGNRRLQVQPGQFVNGVEVTSLISTNFIYAESDTRGGSQVQYLFSPDINCTGKTNVYVSYHSVYEQNQDSIGAVEYSIDGGTNWLPIVYMVDTADLVKDAAGNIDAYATLSAEQGDTAKYVDPVTGEDRGGSYGAFVGVASNKWSTLAPFISGRINDDSVESKRVELFPLPQADNQAKVRLRFAQGGTGSWYFGVDDVGLYTIQAAQAPKITASPTSQIVSAGSTVTLTVAATGDDLKYQWQLNGSNLSGQTGATLTLANVQAANAGDYRAVVSNSGGDATSDAANIQVFSGDINQNLVAHLKFDNDLKDASGKNNNGTAVGTPTFDTAGKVGAAVKIPSGSDYVTLGTPADLNFGTTNDFSIAFWTKLTSWSSDASFIGNKDWNSGSNPGYVLATDDDAHLQWNLAGSPGTRKDYDGAPGALTNGWHHIAVTFQRSGTASTYIDGKLVDARPMTANQNDVNTPADKATNIGQDGTGTYGSTFSDTDIDDLGIWRRVLTPQEVAAIVTAGNAGKDLSQATVTGGGPGPQFTKISRANDGSITIEWTGGGTLQASPVVTGPWQDVTGATSPYTLKPTTPTLFGRIKQ